MLYFIWNGRLMSKKIYYSLVTIFIIVFIIGITLLTKQPAEYDLEMWSYYSGGQNVAVNYFNQNTDYDMKFTGIAADNYTTKIDTAIASDQLPDIIMIDSKDLGRYVNNNAFADFNQVFKGDNQYQQYLDHASEYGLNLAQSGDKQVGVKFENSSSIFAYRSDLASMCLGIDNSHQMAAATQSYQDYTKLYNQLQASEKSECNQLSMFATSEYTNFILNPNNIITVDNEVNKDVVKWLEWIKKNNDTQMVYSRFGQYHELIDDSGETAFFGDVTTVNQLRDFYDFKQDDKWAITQTPINYQGNTSYFMISSDANFDAVRQFFDLTYFNQEWLSENINEVGVVENATVMDHASLDEVNLEAYFTNDDLYAQFNTAAHKTINHNQDITTTYDYGIRNTMNGVMNDYIDGKLKKNNVMNRIESDLKTFYS